MIKSLFYATILFVAQHAQAQEFFGDLMSPQAPAWSLRASAEDAAPMSQQKFAISAPVTTNPTDAVTLSWKWSQLNLETNPSHLYNTDFGLGYKHVENANHFWGFHSSVGSAGDQIFHSRTKTTWSVTGFYSTTQDPTSRWIWLIHDSNNRSFLNEIPIPGVAYLYAPSRDFIGVFGFPFVFIRLKLDEDWSSQIVLAPFTYKLEFSRKLRPPLQLFLAAENTLQSFYREEREREEDRLFYTESRLLVGLKSPIHQYVMAEVYAGFAYNRSLLERENYGGYSSDSVNLDNRRMIGAQITGRL